MQSRDKFTGVALAPFLRSCPGVITLGIRPCLDDYSKREKELLLSAPRIFFPTPRYVDIFQAIDKPTFPRATTYHYQRSRTLQQLLFDYFDYPRPRTRIYYGRRQKKQITEDFAFPVLVMGPWTTSGSSYLARNVQELEACIHRHHCVIVQEAFTRTERLQLVCVAYRCIGIMRSQGGESQGCAPATTDPEDPDLREPLSVTHDLLRVAHLDDILVEWGCRNGQWLLLGMLRPPARWNHPQGLFDRHRHICGLIQEGIL